MGLPRIAFIELTVFPGVYPLAAGYMRAVSAHDERLKGAFAFEIYSICVNNSSIEQQLNAIEAEVYAISCYVWNMGFIRRWLKTLMTRRPNAYVILGGPQVMNQGKCYLDPGNERLFLCNGEGEFTFANLLAQFLSRQPDFAAVRGLTFARNGELVTTLPQPRVEDLDRIPSPFLEGYLESDRYVWAPLETNRGCPFQCTYCYWGAATNARVFRFDMDRVKAEITWLSKHRALFVFITDANFGMLARDIQIAQHLAECKQNFGYPLTVFFSAAKNSPERVTEITKTLGNAGLISTQPVSLQTLDSKALVSVKRSNIKESSYIRLQRELRENDLASFIEMIWPLPGETLESYKTGLGALCSSEADAFVIHHLLLLNNVEMAEQRDRYKLQVTDDADPNSEAQVVVATKDVSPEQYKEGVRFGYHVTSLYSLRALRIVARHLDTTGHLSFKQFFSCFSEYCAARPFDPYTEYINNIIDSREQTKFSANGGIFHITLHQFRSDFDHLLHDFLKAQDLLRNEFISFFFELDLLNRPHVYYNTPISNGAGLLNLIQIISRDRDCMVVKIPAGSETAASQALGLRRTAGMWRIRYRTDQLPYMDSKPYEDNLSYCESKLHKMRSILPIWTAA